MKNSVIPDPIEIMNSRIDDMASMVDAEGKYPCPSCGKMFQIEDGFPCDMRPDTDVVCPECAPEWFQKRI